MPIDILAVIQPTDSECYNGALHTHFCCDHQQMTLENHIPESLHLFLKKRLRLLEETSPRASCYLQSSLIRKQTDYFCLE